MTANEAKELSNNSSSILKVRKELDKAIEKTARNGLRKLTTFIYDEHPHEIIVESLKKDGFKASCRYDCDRDGEMWTYKISW